MREAVDDCALLRRALDALTERISDQRLAIAEEWEEREREWGERIEAAEASAAAFRDEARQLEQKLLEQARGPHPGRVSGEELRTSPETEEASRRCHAKDVAPRDATLPQEVESLRSELRHANDRVAGAAGARRASEDAVERAGRARSVAIADLEFARREGRGFEETLARIREELHALRQEHEQLARFHGMVLGEVEALEAEKRALANERDQVLRAGHASRGAAEERIRLLEQDWDSNRRELERLQNSRLLRYTGPLRAAYGFVRRLLGLTPG